MREKRPFGFLWMSWHSFRKKCFNLKMAKRNRESKQACFARNFLVRKHLKVSAILVCVCVRLCLELSVILVLGVVLHKQLIRMKNEMLLFALCDVRAEQQLRDAKRKGWKFSAGTVESVPLQVFPFRQRFENVNHAPAKGFDLFELATISSLWNLINVTFRGNRVNRSLIETTEWHPLEWLSLKLSVLADGLSIHQTKSEANAESG